MAVNLSPVGGVAGQFFDNNGDPLVGGKLYTYAAGTTTPQTTYTSSLGTTPNSNPIILNAGGRVPSEIWLTDGLSYKFVLYTSTDQLVGSWDDISGINSNFVNFTSSQEIQTATSGQTVFTLTTMQYQPGTNSLTVYVDGVNQYGPGALYAYTETDDTTVTFNAGLHVGAEVKFTTVEQATSSATDAASVAYQPAGTGAVTTNVQAKLRETVSVKDFGAVGDGVTDDTAAIQAAIDAHDDVHAPSGTYLVSSAILVKTGKKFSGDMDAVFKPATAAITVFQLYPSSFLSGVTVDVSGVTYTGIAVDINTANGSFGSSTFCTTQDIKLISAGLNGKAIALRSNTGTNFVSFCQIDATITGFEYGLYLNETVNKWVNGNYFTGLISGCKYHIYQAGTGEIAKNIYNTRHQPGASDAIGWWVVNGLENIFSGTMWDTATFTDIAVKFEATSGNNNLVFSPEGFNGERISSLNASARNNTTAGLVSRTTVYTDAQAGSWPTLTQTYTDGVVNLSRIGPSPSFTSVPLYTVNLTTLNLFLDLILNITTVGLPSASAALEGALRYRSRGSGTPSELWVCMKNSADGYEWVQIGTSS